MRSLDITLMILSGKDWVSSSAILSTPGPINLIESLARHLGQLNDISSMLPHWWQSKRFFCWCITNQDEHWEHWCLYPHSTHKLKGEYPLLFKKIKACSLFDKHFSISFLRSADIHWFFSNLFFDKSTKLIWGRGKPEYCLDKKTWWYFLWLILLMVSKEGVAEARINLFFSKFAFTTARSLAWYRMLSSCLYDESCSSSITVSPKFVKGKKRLDRAPITTIGSPA